MNKQNEIEQMTKIIEFADCTNKCEQAECNLAPCCRKNIATALYNAGYRKQSDTAREILFPIRESYREVIRTGRITMMLDQIEEIAKEYEVEV